jgi:hypothetical protein
VGLPSLPVLVQEEEDLVVVRVVVRVVVVKVVVPPPFETDEELEENEVWNGSSSPKKLAKVSLAF